MKPPGKVFTPKARARVLKGRKTWEKQYGIQTENMARASTKQAPKIHEAVGLRRTRLNNESALTSRMNSRMNTRAAQKIPNAPKPKMPKPPTTPLVKNKKDVAIGVGVGAAGMAGLTALSIRKEKK